MIFIKEALVNESFECVWLITLTVIASGFHCTYSEMKFNMAISLMHTAAFFNIF